MTFSFEPTKNLVVIDAAILGASKDAILRLCLDTGAERTVLSNDAIQRIGIESDKGAQNYSLKTAGGEIKAPLVVLPRIFTLGTLKENFPVYVYTLPTETAIDGLLGLDFMRGHVITLDFRIGEISFE